MDAEAVLNEWRDRAGAYSPGYYAYVGADEASEAVEEVLVSAVGKQASVLELGHGAGRHLAHLHTAGFSDLAGIDINERARDVLVDTYPELAGDGSFTYGAIEDVVVEFEDDAFDAVFSVQTLQHVHPDHDWVFTEIGRITGQCLVTVEIERTEGSRSTTGDSVSMIDDSFPIYHRDWAAVFSDRGLSQVGSRELDRATLRAFEPADSTGRL